MLSPHSGFSFRDVKPFEVMFPLMHYGGSIFPFQVSVSAHIGPENTCDGLIFTSRIYCIAFPLCSGYQYELQCAVEDRKKVERACVVSMGVS